MVDLINRRAFLGTAATAGIALGPTCTLAADDTATSSKLKVGIMGTGGRGTELAKVCAHQPGVEVAYVCDVDQRRVAGAAEAVNKIGGKLPRTVADFRRILDDKSVDVLVVAACNHWHAPATIMACAAGKHVYVEKPCSHCPREGELMVEAAKKHKRHVQMGNQRRSWPKIIEAIDHVRNGLIGRAYFAQCWYHNDRPSIGTCRPASVPDWLDYDLWQGPAPRRPFHDNYLHYNWHWFWHWGNGELGNNGVHFIDLCRWGLGVDYPIRVTSSGGRYRYHDDQETPDTNIATFDFEGRKSIAWEGLSCSRVPGDRVPDVLFHADNGTLAIHGSGYTVYDPMGKEVRKATGPRGDASHVANFLEGVRGSGSLNSEIQEGYKSTLLCHLGNIAYRTGRALHCAPANGHILDDRPAMSLWSKEYEKGWEWLT